jgi:hypothetical protein
MVVEQITTDEFYRLRPPHEGDIFCGGEKAIYATLNRQVLVVVFKQPGWQSTLVAFVRGDAGRYVCRGSGSGVPSLQAATQVIDSLVAPRLSDGNGNCDHGVSSAANLAD